MAKKINRKNPLVLAMDSSNSPLLVAISCGMQEISSIKKIGVKQEQFVFDIVDKLLAKKSAKIKDIDKFFFLKGPGRFTGIRISLTIASILKELNKTQISSATVFDVLYEQAKNSRDFLKNPDMLVAVVIHAFRDEYFCQVFDKKSKPIWTDIQGLKKYLAKFKKPLYLIGNGKDNSSLKTFLPAKYSYASKNLCSVKPETLMKLATKTRFDKKTLEPLYLKPAKFER